MTSNIIPSRHFRYIAWIGGITVCFLIAGAGAAAAALRYDQKNREVVMQGVKVGGVNIGGMSDPKARSLLLSRFDEPLDRPISVEAHGQTFTTTPRQLGVTTDVAERFSEVASTDGMSVIERVWLRLTDRSLGRDVSVKTTFDEKKLGDFIDGVASAVNASAKDADIAFDAGILTVSEGSTGFELERSAARDALKAGIQSDDVKVPLAGKTVEPALHKQDVKDVLVVKIGENKLVHYRGQDVVKVYDVATGQPKYQTPRGRFKIVNKRFRPTWNNPAKFPGGWGYNLPASIPPGPGNPLGTRAMDLDAPGIRIHGTSADYSMGYNASHGCIRMRIPDVEELFGQVEVGTPVLIVQTAPLRPLLGKPKAVPEPDAESDGTKVPGQPAAPPPSPQPSPSPSPSPSTVPAGPKP